MIASAGVASRRAAEEMIAAGRVRVEGRVVTKLGTRVDPKQARIEVDGERIGLRSDHRYIVLNKPAGVLTTVHDPEGRATVLDLVRSDRRLFPVGRLDGETMGLLLLTTDGELAHRLAHPRFQVPRTYLADVQGRVTRQTMEQILAGVRLDDGPARPRSARVRAETARRTQLEIVMTEGRKHEVRRILEAVGHPVGRLVRTGFGPLRLGRLKVGGTRELTPTEVGRLLATVGL